MTTHKNSESGIEINDKGSFVLEGRAYWAFVTRTNPLTDPPKYTMELALDQKTANALRKKGINVKNKGEKDANKNRGDFVTLTSTFKPKLVDSKANEIKDDKFTFGNESVVKVVTKIFSRRKNPSQKNDTGLSLGLLSVQVLKRVAYESANNLLKDETLEGSGEFIVEHGSSDDELPFRIAD